MAKKLEKLENRENRNIDSDEEDDFDCDQGDYPSIDSFRCDFHHQNGLTITITIIKIKTKITITTIIMILLLRSNDSEQYSPASPESSLSPRPLVRLDHHYADVDDHDDHDDYDDVDDKGSQPPPDPHFF